MSYATEHIAETLKAARERKGLSQRALSAKAGVPQSHISKIESGAVDLRLSSLVELARALDLEFALVPRKKLPAVRGIIRGDGGQVDDQASRKAANLLRRIKDQISELPGERLSEIAELQRRARELSRFKMSDDDLVHLQEASSAMKAFLSDPGNLRAVEQAHNQLRLLHNALAHGRSPEVPGPRPAYRLDGDNHG